MQRAGAYLPPHIPDPHLQTPQQDEQQHQQEQQRQARHTQYTPEQQNDFSDFSLLSNAFGASQSRPPPTMLPNPSWLFASPSMARPNWHASGLQTPPQYAPAFGARTPYAGSPAQYQPSRPNSPFPAWMAPSSSAIAGPSAQTPTFIPDYDDNWSAFPVCFFNLYRAAIFTDGNSQARRHQHSLPTTTTVRIYPRPPYW
jgi:hypothetical protein